MANLLEMRVKFRSHLSQLAVGSPRRMCTTNNFENVAGIE